MSFSCVTIVKLLFQSASPSNKVSSGILLLELREATTSLLKSWLSGTYFEEVEKLCESVEALHSFSEIFGMDNWNGLQQDRKLDYALYNKKEVQQLQVF